MGAIKLQINLDLVFNTDQKLEETHCHSMAKIGYTLCVCVCVSVCMYISNSRNRAIFLHSLVLKMYLCIFWLVLFMCISV